MYCPACFQNTLKLKTNGVVRLSFNGKSRNNSLFTYNLAKDSGADLAKKLREKITEFMAWYLEFQHRPPVKTVDVFSSDCRCDNNCKLSLNTRVSVIGVMFTFREFKHILDEEAQKHGVEVELTPS